MTKTIAYDQIKFGDLIKVTRTYNKGTVSTIEGRAFFLGGRSIGTEDRETLVYSSGPDDRYTSSVVVELLDRPKMPFRVGTVISASLKNGTGGNFVRVEKASDDDELLWLELGGVGDNYITEEDIKEWQELKLVPFDAKVVSE